MDPDSDAGSSAGDSDTESLDANSDTRPIDPDTEAVLEDLESIDVNTTPPIELVSKVQELQERLEE